MTPITPETPYGLFTFFLSAEHLKGKSHTVTIKEVELMDIWDPRMKAKVTHVVLRFDKAQRVLKCNKTHLEALMTITGKEKFKEWEGAQITLTPARSSNGKDTITITAHPPTENPPEE